jgi:UDP-N-acetyl-D-mannosaminuronic acid dehydrogenase
MKILGVGKETIIAGLTQGEITFAVYGMGKMGLPLAMVFAEAGATVIGVDINEQVTAAVSEGKCYIVGEPGLSEMLAANVKRSRFSATTNGVKAAKNADVMVILVPSLLDKSNNPDLTALTTASANIAQGLKKGDLVIVETTVPPNTTRDIVLPILKHSGLREGEFGLAFCPERTSSGRAIKDITGAYVKIVGGIDEASAEAAAALYSVINKKGVKIVTDTTTAEAVKLFEGIYRDVNIALANELALICKEIGVSSTEIFTLVNEPFDEVRQRPLFNLHQPGAGVGGHCIPVYPYFITRTTQQRNNLIKTAREINDSMPLLLVDLVAEALTKAGGNIKNANVLVLGIAYRAGVKESSFTPAMPLVKKLKKLHANVFLYDPLYSPEEIEGFGARYSNYFDGMDCVVIITDHQEFKGYNWQDIAARMRHKVIVDGRQVVNPAKLSKLGFIYEGIGY